MSESAADWKHETPAKPSWCNRRVTDALRVANSSNQYKRQTKKIYYETQLQCLLLYCWEFSFIVYKIKITIPPLPSLTSGCSSYRSVWRKVVQLKNTQYNKITWLKGILVYHFRQQLLQFRVIVFLKLCSKYNFSTLRGTHLNTWGYFSLLNCFRNN